MTTLKSVLEDAHIASLDRPEWEFQVGDCVRFTPGTRYIYHARVLQRLRDSIFVVTDVIPDQNWTRYKLRALNPDSDGEYFTYQAFWFELALSLSHSIANKRQDDC